MISTRCVRLGVSLLTVSVVSLGPLDGNAASPSRTATRVVEYAATPVRVRLSVGSSTQVEMPEEVVDMVTMLEPTHVTLSYSGPYVHLHALTALEGEVFVITTSGASYPLTLTTTTAEADAAVRIVATGTRAKQREHATAGLTAVGLIRAMARSEIPPGVEHLLAKGQRVYHDGTLQLTLQAAYISPQMRGYVLQAENLTGVSVPVPVEELEMPGLLAVGSVAQVLYPQPKTVEERLAGAYQSLVYVVVRRDAATPEPVDGLHHTAVAPAE
jgi:hypothetical protein